MQLYALLTIINMEVCVGSNKTVNPFAQSEVLIGKHWRYPVYTSCMDHVVTSSRHTSQFPDRKSSISVYDVMQMLTCWQYWNLSRVYMQTCNSGWKFKIKSHIKLGFSQKNMQSSESNKDCRTASVHWVKRQCNVQATISKRLRKTEKMFTLSSGDCEFECQWRHSYPWPAI